jgi:hypothetical protein
MFAFSLWGIIKSNHIKLYLSHAPKYNKCRPYCEMLTYKPLTNSAVQEELRKYLRNKLENYYKK